MLHYARLGGAPVYEASVWWVAFEEHAEMEILAKIAALRFERAHEPEKHNPYNDWDKKEAFNRRFRAEWNEESYWRERAKEDRTKAAALLRLARAAPERLPSVINVRSLKRSKAFTVQFPWGRVTVERYRFPVFDSVGYRCHVSHAKAEDPKVASDLACAAAMLAEFPRLAIART
ncbi:MAG: hypothetical protein JO062_16750 [Bryobacterales bacterium]|nr:hypothetical protein [Bryobacterales bacterium]